MANSEISSTTTKETKLADITIPVEEWTEAIVEGNGVFDVLMKANKAHLEQEYAKNRIKGGEYATVYLGSLEHVLQTSLEFVLQRRKLALESLLMEKQIAIAEMELEQAKVALEIARMGLEKIPAEIELLKAQAAQTRQQTENLVETKEQIIAETANTVKQKDQIIAQTSLTNKQVEVAQSNIKQSEAQTKLIDQQRINAVTQNDTMIREQCKLAAEYDLILQQIQKLKEEGNYINQRIATEKAQTSNVGVDPNSVIGIQNRLISNQADGFKRTAEQEVARILTSTWSTRRTTDDATQANSTNRLDDANVGRAITKLLQGIGI
ncbi:Uncharacterised protein [Oligella urethralis]|uniref:hypothetical protein n=1 Tax=Oligella urethralis TaxID=90245 RepID=UPI000E0483B5|nr:hypothetical protein [Oligella urethralis]SUA63312.1 Uncharacterised protein [Oligella urethralis]